MKYEYLFDGTKISRFGFGLYKGENSNKGDTEMLKSIIYGLNKGINIIDTAQRYRNGRSEKIIKKVLNKFGKREKLIISSKVGLIPDYIKKNKILNKLKVQKSNCLLEHDFCIDPKFINWSVDNSLRLMNTRYIDFYLLHNPELSLKIRGGYKKIISALIELEIKRRQKKIINYGISTWNGFRRYSNNKNFLDIEKVVSDIEKQIGSDHGFKCIEAPVSIGMPDLLNYKPSTNFKFLDFLNKKQINFFSSASLYEGNLENLIELNKIFSSMNKKKDMLSENTKAKVSFPMSENSLRRLFILLENFKNNKLFIGDNKLNIRKFKNINSLGINSLKTLKFIKTSLIGMEKKKIVKTNFNDFNYVLNIKEIKYINKIWKKIKKNL